MHRRSYHAQLAITQQLLALRYVLLIAVIAAITLPFHYITSEGMIVLKKRWGIENTFVTQSDIDEMVHEYSIGGKIEKAELLDQSWVTKIMYDDAGMVNLSTPL